MTEEQEELHTMQMVAISIASLENTEDSIKDRLGMDNPHWSVAYRDVCTAVDREMEERKHKETLIKALKELEAHHVNQNRLKERPLALSRTLAIIRAALEEVQA